MKRNYVFMLFFSSLATIASNSIAQPTTPPNAPPNCTAIYKACREAGYLEAVDVKSNKNIFMNCMNPIMSGQIVTRVPITPKIVQACRSEISNQPCLKILNQCHDAGFDGTVNRLPMFDCLFPLVNGKKINGVNPDPKDFASCKASVDDQIKTQPCLRVILACKAAGYSPDPANGEIFVRNCYNPLIKGEIVMGVTIDPASVKACRNFNPAAAAQKPKLQ